MLISMTGFGRAEGPLPHSSWAVVEIHTLNHRFLEVECRLPEGFQMFDGSIRAMIAQAIRRGRVRVSVVLKAAQPHRRILFHTAVARSYLAQVRRLKQQLKLPGPVTLEMVLGLPEVVAKPQQELLPNRVWPSLKRCISKALTQAVRMRSVEGKRLARAMANLTRSLKKRSLEIRKHIPRAEGEMRKRFAERIKAVAHARNRGKIDTELLAAEAASFVQTTDVTEELARMNSHLVALHQAVQGRVESPGRTMDFLLQELQREVNTLGSKMRDGKIVQRVVAMKGQMEKLREQAANVE